MSLGLPLNMLSVVDSLLILNENFLKVVYRYKFHCLFLVFIHMRIELTDSRIN